MKQPDVTHEEATASGDTSAIEPSWAWLTALAQSLSVVVELTDARGVPAISLGSTATAAALRAALADTRSTVHEAVARTLASGEPQTGVTGTLRTVCYRLVRHGASAGVLVLARDSSDSFTGGDSPSELERVGPWLARAVEAHIAKVPVVAAPSSDPGDVHAFDRVSSLHRILHEMIDRGSERDLVTAFAEALFAWEGIELFGYVEDIQGRFALSVATPGAVRGHATVTLEPNCPPRTVALTPMTAEDLEGLGLAGTRRAFGLQIASSVLEPWQLVFSEGFGTLDLERLHLYLNLLREALGRTATIAETRTTWAILQPLLGAREPVEAAVDEAIQELMRTVQADHASLTVTSSDGAIILSVGDLDGLPAVRSFARNHLLVSTTPVPDQHTMVLSLRRAPGQTFTRREQHLVDRTAGVFAAWLPGILKSSIRLRERRAERRDFEQVLDRTADQTVEEGLSVSVVVVSVPGAAPRPEVLQRWVADIRGQLRGSDLAGMLSEREIGVLLSGTPMADVPIVSARLEQCLAADRQGTPLCFGTATRDSHHRVEGSLVRAARRNAALGAA